MLKTGVILTTKNKEMAFHETAWNGLVIVKLCTSDSTPPKIKKPMLESHAVSFIAHMLYNYMMDMNGFLRSIANQLQYMFNPPYGAGAIWSQIVRNFVLKLLQ